MFNVYLCSLEQANAPVFNTRNYSDGVGGGVKLITVYDNYPDIPGHPSTSNVECQTQPGPGFASEIPVGSILLFEYKNYSAKVLSVDDRISGGTYWTAIEIEGRPPDQALLVGATNKHFTVWEGNANWADRTSATSYSSPSTTSGNKMYTVTRQVIEAECSSSIQDGFTRATITLRKKGLEKEISGSDITDWLVLITSLYGVVWEGYISSCSARDDQITIDCSGYKSKLDDVFYNGYFEKTWPSPYTIVTSGFIISDILKSLEGVYEYPNQSVDRGHVIYSKQAAAWALDGTSVAPRDYTQTAMTARSAMDDILRIGAPGMDDFPALTCQIWDGKIARTQLVYQRYYSSDAQWIIEEHNMPSDSERGFTLDRSKYTNSFFVSYRGVDGAEAYTSSKRNQRDLAMHGIKEKMIAGGDISLAEAALVIDAQLSNRINTGVVGDIQLVGEVKNKMLGGKKSAFMIRGGDILFIPSYDSSVIPFSNGTENSGIVVAGEVNSDLVNGTTTITPYGYQDKAELAINQLEI